MASTGNSYAKEMAIRRRITDIYNKREEDFLSLREYNDYLEEVEDMTFNLIEGIDVSAIEAKIARYYEENSEQIMNARARKAEELAAALKASKGQPAETGKMDIGITQGTQATAGPHGQYAPAIVTGAGLSQPRPMASQPVPLGQQLDLMEDYADENEESQRLRSEKEARAGGWTMDLSRERALEEAFSSIWL